MISENGDFINKEHQQIFLALCTSTFKKKVTWKDTLFFLMDGLGLKSCFKCPYPKASQSYLCDGVSANGTQCHINSLKTSPACIDEFSESLYYSLASGLLPFGGRADNIWIETCYSEAPVSPEPCLAVCIKP